jgi:hypothetical protein
MPLHRNSGSWGRILLGLTLKPQLSTRLALMICLRRKLTVGKKSRVTRGGGIAMSRRFSTSTLLTRPKPFPSEPIREEVESLEWVVIPCAAPESEQGALWKPEHRVAADRCGLRCDSDLTDTEWALIAPWGRRGRS